MNKTLRFSDDSSEHLRLVNAFISSIESCVIGYQALNLPQCCNGHDASDSNNDQLVSLLCSGQP